MLNMLYLIIISPLVQVLEFSFVFFYKIFNNLTVSLFGVSLTVSLLSLPLYNIAERYQSIERNTIKALKPKIDKIKSVFSGDEQFMILSVFYKQNNYHPIKALLGSISILVQIPFFIAAYSYLSNLEILKGIDFYFIKDLGNPDSLLKIGSYSINILPIIMTFINCVSGFLYTKNLLLRDKIQVYGIAFVFLILLYKSPSCLVIYWTLNNIFSLFKNLLIKMHNPLRKFYLSGCIVIFLFIIYLLFFMPSRVFSKRILVICIVSIFYFIPFIIKLYNNIVNKYFNLALKNKNKFFLLLFSCLSMVILSGLYIPSSVISTSPGEFSFIDSFSSPFIYIIHSSLFYFGFFFLWPVCIYLLFSEKIKFFLSFSFLFIAILSIIFTLFFSGNYGIIDNIFNFETTAVLKSSAINSFLSLILIIPIIFFSLIFFKYNKISALSSFFMIIIISFIIISFVNILKIDKSFKQLRIQHNQNEEISSLKPIFSLSKNNNNIIVIMADASISGFVPYIFNDHQCLYEQFSGFTLFPNTASFSNHTLLAVPPLWGGYEYSPMEMNKKSSIPLVDKHNEALLVLPLLLSNTGFKVTVTDPSWANYSWIPDNSIYDKYDDITAFNTMKRYTDIWYNLNEKENSLVNSSRIKRNIIWFSFLKINNPLLRSIIYDSGWYWSTENMGTSLINFINSYAVLDFLPFLTEFDSKYPSALLITNETTHDAAYFNESPFKVSSTPVKMGISKFSDDINYHTNTALYIKLGSWFDLLKENGVYDNTRILIVADHGKGILGVVSEKPIANTKEIAESYNPVLLFKDFYQNEPLKINNDFMTNADVPSVILKELIENPKNPFTGNPINTDVKNDGIYISTNHIPMADAHGKYTFNIKNNQWLFIKDSIFEPSNWRVVDK